MCVPHPGRFVLELPQYEALLADNPVTDWLVHGVLRKEAVPARLAKLTTESADLVVRRLATIVAGHLEKLFLQRKVSHATMPAERVVRALWVLAE